MAIRNAAGTAVSKSTLLTNVGAAITTEAQYTVDQFYYQDFTFESEAGTPGSFNRGRAILFYPGQVVSATQINAAFPTGAFTSITPATGAAAGGTAVTIKGTNLSGATAVAIGGVAATSFVLVNDTTITCVTGAHAAGAVNVVITDDAGAITGTNAFTYV